MRPPACEGCAWWMGHHCAVFVGSVDDLPPDGWTHEGRCEAVTGICGLCGRETKLILAPWRNDRELAEMFGDRACRACATAEPPRCDDCGRFTRAVELDEDARGYVVIELDPPRPPLRAEPILGLFCGRCAANREVRA